MSEESWRSLCHDEVLSRFRRVKRSARAGAPSGAVAQNRRKRTASRGGDRQGEHGGVADKRMAKGSIP